MEQYIMEAIGLGHPQLQPEPLRDYQSEPQRQVTIYDFGDLLAKNEPSKINLYNRAMAAIKSQ